MDGPHVPAVLKQWRKDAEQQAERGELLGPFLNRPGYDMFIRHSLHSRQQKRAEKVSTPRAIGFTDVSEVTEDQSFMAELERDRKAV